MTATLKRRSSSGPTIGDARLTWPSAWFALIAFALFMKVPLSFAQATAEFRRTLAVASAQPVTLDVEVADGDLQIMYGRDGQISVFATAKSSADARLDDNFFSKVLTIDQKQNHLIVRHVANATYPEAGISFLYRIDVPYRTEITSILNRGKQNISGVLGPVTAVTHNGDIKASYVTKGLQARADTGNLDIQVIGEHVEAQTGRGNISCSRVALGVNAETEDGDITLMLVGPSTATVQKGTGRIDVGGARGILMGSTDKGDLHVRAIPRDDWQLRSASGNVRLDLPLSAKLELDVSTTSGEVRVDREDIAKPNSDLHHFSQTLNGGGKRIQVRTESGGIVIR